MSEELLTTTEIARLAGVTPTSVKRWADSRALPCVRTAGGHRRFRRSDLELFLREQDAQASRPGAQSHWLELMLGGSVLEIQAELLRARDRAGAFSVVAEELAGAFTELGSAWERGEVTILEEHVASEKVARALQRIAEAIPGRSSAPACLLASAEGDEHTLGLSLVELCLREAGWASLWAGRGTPPAELDACVLDGGVRMLALSASVYSGSPRRLAAQARRARDACAEAGALLVLGGRGAWPATLEGATRFADLGTFSARAREWLREVR